MENLFLMQNVITSGGIFEGIKDCCQSKISRYGVDKLLEFTLVITTKKLHEFIIKSTILIKSEVFLQMFEFLAKLSTFSVCQVGTQ